MSNTVRIRTTPNGSDKYLKVNLQQDFDFVEILSLKITQEDAYRKFCSDYGVIVGRVVINSGFGVPNAKVSVFIPLDEVDKNDPLISGLYPFEVITDRDNDGVRYNLLPKDAETNNDCYTPIGTFPTKREVLDNDALLNVYCKYYKFTTTTNHAGDFMLFGVPLGTYTVHVDADISDIGIGSQRPYDLISQGTPNKFFYSPTKFNGGTNLDKLVQVKTLNSGVNVQPFWGDTENCELGITRLDFDLNYTIRPSAIFMGSIYGDQDKHSINKKCRPRKKLGLMCEQITGPGFVNMIRKTIDGTIESFDVEGGRVIDDDGTWAYQIPMNLDYMVTDEVGNLILSQDPNKGIPTRASVRFSIGMDETGGEGRIRTRAKYLVPNNPTTTNEIDYEFGEKTKESSFKDLYWNKIYSVSNFISRFQRDNDLQPVKTRGITGMKDVDACAGDKTPFPYNRVNTSSNPIFFIICLIIKIMAFLIYVMNAFLIPLINVVIHVINVVIGGIVNTINGIINAINTIPGININTISFTPLNYIGCVSVKCPDDDPSYFAPGCSNGGLDGGLSFNAANPTPNYYNNDPAGHTGFGNAAGLDDCIAFEMAKTLNLFEFDFYNDWVNGTLFGFLLKYKKKRKGREVFCEYDCDGFVNDPNYTGVDGNQNGVPDNGCHNNLLLDTCFNGGGNDCQHESHDSGTIREGLIKKVDDNFYYAATTHNLNYKLFATDVICLGSVFDCDWQGIPQIQKYLIPTTYKTPPDVQELADDNITMETCGMVGIGGNTTGEFFEVNCLGLHTDITQCLNIRHICEFGVDIDQAIEDQLTGNILTPADCVIGSNDIDDDQGKWFRDVFTGLNSGTTTPNSLSVPNNGYTTNFNLSNTGSYYNFASPANNGQDYVNFRGYLNDSSYAQPKHSYYFYFGILPGKTALEKMNQRFFTTCNVITRNDMLIQASSTPSTGFSGTITFTFIGGQGPYTYRVTGPNGYLITGSTTSGPIVLNSLDEGSYLISGFDLLGNPVNQIVIVSGPTPLYCSVSVTRNSSTANSNDGEITISSVGGGIAPYTYEVKTFAGVTVGGPAPLSTPYVQTGLAVDNLNGYRVIISDSSSPIGQCITTGLTVNGPTNINLTTTPTNVTCFGGNDGNIVLNINGGSGPYMISTTGPGGYTSSALNMAGLFAGTYTTTVVDSLSTTATITTVLSELNPHLTILTPTPAQIAQQCSPTNYMITFYVASYSLSVGATVFAEYQIDGVGAWNPVSFTYTNQTTPMTINVPQAFVSTKVTVRFRNAASTCYSNIVTYLKTVMVLPPVTLVITPNAPTNIKQCSPTTLKIGFTLSHILRAPYTVNYTVNNVAKPSVTFSPATTSTVNIITTTPVGVGAQNIVMTVTDNKGCVANKTFTNVVPAALLHDTISSTIIGMGPNYTKKVLQPSGGFSPYTSTPYTILTNYVSSTPITTTITDNVGCTITISG